MVFPRTSVISLCACILSISLCVQAVPLNLFYPFGDDVDDTVLRSGDDVSSDEIDLDERFVFFNNSYDAIYVNLNGHVSFDTEVPSYRGDLKLPLGLHVIAIFLADVDTSAGGKVYYRSTSENSVIQRAASDIQSHFSGFESYMPTSLFIVTWEMVGYFPGKADKVNTFQLILTSDGLDTFAIFHYLDDGMQWLLSEGKLPASAGINDVPPQAGFENGRGGASYTLPGSGTTGTFATGSNVNTPGVWMYHIGDTGSGNVRSADGTQGDVTVFEVGTATQDTCFSASRPCHRNAQCVDNPSGFCCECIKPFYGNGHACLERENNQRLHGPVQGTVNGVSMDILFYAHVMTKDGRSHFNIYPLPDKVGPAMVTLTSIGGVVGWLFAKPSNPMAISGYSFTGDKFNRTAVVTFQSTDGGMDKQVRILQTFMGHDAPDKIRVITRLEGEIPEIPEGADVTIDDYTENFKRTAPGIIKSFVARVYRVNGVAYRYSWDNTIEFTECSGGITATNNEIMKLSVTRHYAVYDERAEVVRYALTTKVGTMAGGDPCSEAENPCGPNSDCVPNGNTYTCLCMPGFSDRSSPQCQDINECERYPCDDNAECYNTEGSYKCQCRAGFTGDGRTCRVDAELCGDQVCATEARCIIYEGRQRCVCNDGYRGNGLSCAAVDYDCRSADICSDNAQCVFDEDLREYVCECMDEFSGDGYSCEAQPDRGGCASCDRYAVCVTDIDSGRLMCQCRPGYTGDGRTCTLIDTCASCDYNSRCVFDENISDYRCVCVRGYEGDGTQCTRRDCREDESMCAEEGGLCWTNPQTDQAMCRCNHGYRGDGFTCEPIGCDVFNDCDTNAKCVPMEGRFKCVCNSGFIGDGKRCRNESAGCDVLNNCDVNARCVPVSNDPPRYECRCLRGFKGDGKTCQEVAVPCNQVNNCDRNAECMYDPDRLSYRCVCSRGFEGDGLYCRRREVIDCRRDPRLCSENAECVRGSTESYVCVCEAGYRGDGATCSPVVREGNYLIYAQGRKLMRVSSDADNDEYGVPLLFIQDQLAVGVDTDCKMGHIYWTDAAKGIIRRSKMDGTMVETLITGLKSPEGVAVDYVAGNLFFTDSEMDTVMVSRLNGTNMKTLADMRMVNPRAIVLDVSRGVVYWTDWNRNRPQIEKMNMDGTGREVLVTEGLRLPNGLAFDSFSQTLCWGDAGTKSIECIRSDGVGRRVVTDQAMYPFDIAMMNNVIFWTDWTVKDISNVDQSGGDPNQPLAPAVGGNGKMYGITAVKDRCPRETNSCGLRDGGCDFLCLPTPNGGRSCACPDGVDPRLCGN